MAVESMISQGLYLMLVGMGFVVCFLTILVMLLNLMERIVDHEEVAVISGSGKQANNTTLTAVITAAIHQHRQQSGK